MQISPYVFPGRKTKPTIDVIFKVVGEQTGATYEEAKSRCRRHECVFFRYASWYFIRKYSNTPFTLLWLGAMFLRDHATVIWALQKCECKYEHKLQALLITCREKFDELGYETE